MTQTLFGKNIAFSVRTFRFTGGQSSNDQDQIIRCELHLEPVDQVVEEQAADCSCYTSDECQLDPEFPFGEGREIYRKLHMTLRKDKIVNL